MAIAYSLKHDEWSNLNENEDENLPSDNSTTSMCPNDSKLRKKISMKFNENA